MGVDRNAFLPLSVALAATPAIFSCAACRSEPAIEPIIFRPRFANAKAWGMNSLSASGALGMGRGMGTDRGLMNLFFTNFLMSADMVIPAAWAMPGDARQGASLHNL